MSADQPTPHERIADLVAQIARESGVLVDRVSVSWIETMGGDAKPYLVDVQSRKRT